MIILVFEGKRHAIFCLHIERVIVDVTGSVPDFGTLVNLQPVQIVDYRLFEQHIPLYFFDRAEIVGVQWHNQGSVFCLVGLLFPLLVFHAQGLHGQSLHRILWRFVPAATQNYRRVFGRGGLEFLLDQNRLYHLAD